MEVSEFQQQLIDKLLLLRRFDIDMLDNGEFIEQSQRDEIDGQFISSSDLDEFIEFIKNLK